LVDSQVLQIKQTNWRGSAHFSPVRLRREFSREFFTVMTIDKSLRIRRGSNKARGVLKRGERITQLQQSERWQSEMSVLGLPKVRVFKLAMKKKKKKKEEEGAEGTAAPAAGGKAAAPAKGAAPAKAAAPAAKGAKK
jgi:small basic protein (TIGR04137 family)